MTAAASYFGRLASATTRTELTALARATAWLNSQPLTAIDLQGKVVLIECLDVQLHQLAAATLFCPGLG